MKNNCTLRKALFLKLAHREMEASKERDRGSKQQSFPESWGHLSRWALVPPPHPGPGGSGPRGERHINKLPQPVQILEQFPWHRALVTGQTNQALRSQTRKTSCRAPHLVEQDSSDLRLSFYIHNTISGICSRKYEILAFRSVHLLTSSRVNKFRVRQPE